MPKYFVAFFCFLSLSWLAVTTLHWPLAGDAALMHYAVFLTRHHMVPYRDIIELNTPCTYLTERAAMTLFGETALGWRLFDFTLLAVACASCISILRPQGWQAGFFAGTLFAAIHCQDGVMMAGQRDLQVAVFQVAALACLLRGLRTQRTTPSALIWPWFFAFGALASQAACTKPPAALLLAVTVLYVVLTAPDRRASLRSFLLPAIAGAAIPVFVSTAYLIAYGASADFWTTWRPLVAYHAQLDRKPFPYLLTHSLSPVIALFVLYIVLQYLTRRNSETDAPTFPLLALATISGWISYAVQGKGFPYQRYLFLVFLLLLISSTVFSALKSSALPKCIAWATLATGLVIIAVSAYRAGTFSHANPYQGLSNDLKSLGAGDLSGSIQCLDTTGGCLPMLYENQLVQSTGIFYDCYMVDGQNALALKLRKRFEDQILPGLPKVLIVTDSVCYGEKRRFDQFASWPVFTNMLNEHYKLAIERNFTVPIRYWTRGEIPNDYRIYVRR